MVNIDEAYKSTSAWLCAADLKGNDAKVTIESASMEEVGSDHKLVVYFKGKEKGLALNKTNARTIAAAYGIESDAWGGKELILFPTMVEYQNKMVEAIRVRARNSAQALDDEIPF